jgi:arylformamidase
MLHWPGDPPFEIHRALDQSKGDICTVSQVKMGVHTGTHMDAPLHFIENARTIDQMPLDVTIGRVRVIQIGNPKFIHRDDIEHQSIEANERILFKTANSNRAWNKEPFNEDFVFIEQSAAHHLAERGVRLVGVDYLSVGGYKQDAVETHRALLGAGIWVIEGLDLSSIEPGPYEMICLPLRLAGCEGSPARAILRSI